MMTVHTYNHILKLAQQLDVTEQLKLLQALLGEISSDVAERTTTKRSITELRGLGREIWQDVDVEKYIEQEHASWDG